MTDYIATDTELASIANAIRTKGGTSASLEFPDEFISAINAIGGGGEIHNQNKTVTPTESQQSVTADTGYTGLGTVTVNAISSSYVGSGVTRRSSTDLSASGATVTAPAGYYESSASKAVASGTAGTPTATKGTVSNHSVTITPSVTNTTGYITGGTKTGTAVTVSASELVSGTKPITANGTGIDVTNYASVNVAVPTSGGGGPAPKKQINFIDYDGTILHSYTKTEWQSVSSLPSNPSHTGLTAQGWNWTKAQIDAQLTAVPDGDIWIGQMYITTSGDTEIDVSMQEGRLDPILTICVKGSVTVDWGDNTASDTVTGTSLTTRKSVSHTYAAAGDYMIKIHVASGSFQFYGNGSYALLRKNTTANQNRVYSNCVQAVRFGSGVTSIGTYAFYYCHSLTSVTIPSGVTSIDTYAFYGCYSLASATIPSGVTSISISAFYYCYSLTSVTMPSGVTSINASAFYNCYSLTSVTIPSGVTSIGNSTFYNCYSLASVTIPSGVTNIGTSVFYNCHSLASVTIPSGVTSIGNTAFNSCYSLASVTIPSGVTNIGTSAFVSCYGVAEYHIKPTSPPTLGTTVFNAIVSDCKIYVPAASLSAYQAATNWSTYASYMVGE